MSSTIEDVTASFAASFALANGDVRDVIDISHLDHDEDIRPSARFYLLAKLLTFKKVNLMDLQAHFKSI
ncbi:hypothetical protein ACLB2K_011360 [Fragaria x ananassa]